MLGKDFGRASEKCTGCDQMRSRGVTYDTVLVLCKRVKYDKNHFARCKEFAYGQAIVLSEKQRCQRQKPGKNFGHAQERCSKI